MNNTYINPPEKPNFILNKLLFIVEKFLSKGISPKKLIANRILLWSPKAFLGSGIMESLVATDDKEIGKRLLNLIRIYTSIRVSCPFCIDMNAMHFRENGISETEILALQGVKKFSEVTSFNEREISALKYVEAISGTPVRFSIDMMENLKSHFSERAIVIIASTCAQVNFWARLIQSFGVSPEGFTENCSILNLEKYKTSV